MRGDLKMSIKVVFIGDVHGKWQEYCDLINLHDTTIQVGDMGIGFNGVTKHPLPSLGRHWYIRGNHDNPTLCEQDILCIPDGSYSHAIKTMFIGGAESIDKDYRIPGLSWWPDEEVSIQEWENIISDYKRQRAAFNNAVLP
jgi:hypothetical protein